LHVVNEKDKFLITLAENKKLFTIFGELCNRDSGFAKKRVQWLIEHTTSHQLLWYIDSFVLRNPLLRKAAKR
jgi:hypothetical protein